MDAKKTQKRHAPGASARNSIPVHLYLDAQNKSLCSLLQTQWLVFRARLTFLSIKEGLNPAAGDEKNFSQHKKYKKHRRPQLYM